MMTLSAVLQEGYIELGRTADQPRPIAKPKLFMGELQALIAFCAAEMDRIDECDVEVRNCPEAQAEILEAAAELISAYQRIDAALAFIERDKHHGGLAA